MKLFKLLLFMVLIGSWQSASSQNQSKIERSYEETLEEFLNVSGTNPKDASMLGQVTNIFPGVDESQNKAIMSLIDKMMDKLMPVYKANYEQDTLEELILFFKSPLGKKYVETNRKIIIESFRITNELTMEVVKEMTKGMRSPDDSDGDK